MYPKLKKQAVCVQLARKRTEQLVHVLPESIRQRTMHLRIKSDELTLERSQR